MCERLAEKHQNTNIRTRGKRNSWEAPNSEREEQETALRQPSG